MIALICVLLAGSCLCAILCPFWLGDGGALEMTSRWTDPAQALHLKQTILERFLKEESAFQQGEITSWEWSRRKQFLENRYIDAVRCFDFLSQNSQKDGAP